MKSLISGMLLGLACALGCYAQPKNDYLPPTPTVAALGKYVDAPVSLYTGTPDVSIPLYEISVGDFTLPISLSYHGGGFRVSEESSWVGLGWSLNATGVISRTIRNVVDNSVRDPFFNDYNGGILNPDDVDDWHVLRRFSMNYVDGVPDLYVYNFNGNSGKFIINNGVQMLPKKAVSISRIGTSGWMAIDAEGNKYLFDIVERAKTRSSGSTATNEEISWYLSKITTRTGDEILFQYKTTEFFQTVSLSESQSYSHQGTSYVPNAPSSNSFTTTQYGRELSRIVFPQGAVEFVSVYDRQDLDKPLGSEGALRLRKIKVENEAGETVKMFYLSQDYFGGNQEHFNYKRLRLNSVTEDLDPVSDENIVGDMKVFSFEYNTGVSLPSKVSKSQDHWGFYNGKPNTSLVPPFVNNPNVSHELQPTREPDAEKVKACLLTRVNYPTGGYVDYEYEAHDYSYVADVLREPTQEKVNYEELPTIFLMAYTNRPEYSPATQAVHTEPFTVPVDQHVKLYVDIQYPPEWVDGSQSQAKLELYTSNISGEPGTLLETYGIGDNGLVEVELEAGSYHLRAIGTMNGCRVRAEIHIADFDVVTVQRKAAGGVRVKKVVQHSGDSPDIVRTITYYDNNNPSISSGSLLEEPQYTRSSKTWTAINEVWCNYRDIHILIVSGQSFKALGTGNHIGYREVQVHYGEANDNGYSISTFTNDPNLTHGTDSDVSWRRGLVKTQKDFDSSNQLVQSVTNEYGFAFEDMFYGLVVSEDGSHPCTGSEVLNPNSYPLRVQQDASVMKSEHFFLKKQTRETRDVAAGTSHTTVEEYFYDNEAHLLPTRTVKEVNDKRLVTLTSYPDDFETTTGFIGDLKAQHNIVPIEQVSWQEETSGSNPTILSAQLFIYQTGGRGLLEQVKLRELAKPLPVANFKFANRPLGVLPPAGTAGAFSPDINYVLKSTVVYDPITFNPIQVTPALGLPTSYIWGYKGELPIAKVINATAATVAFTGFEYDNEGGWNSHAGTSGNARTGKKSFTGMLSKGGLPADTYTVSVWVKEGTGTPSIASQSPIKIGDAKSGWRLYEWEFTTSGTISINTNGAVIDDARLHPTQSQMTSLTYEPLKGPVVVSDPNHIDAFYVYDRIGRLLAVKDADGNVLVTQKYHLKQ